MSKMNSSGSLNSDSVEIIEEGPTKKSTSTSLEELDQLAATYSTGSTSSTSSIGSTAPTPLRQAASSNSRDSFGMIPGTNMVKRLHISRLTDEEIEQLLEASIKDKSGQQTTTIAEFAKLKEEMTSCPLWVLERYRKDIKAKRDNELRLKDLRSSTSSDLASIEKWKTHSQREMQDMLIQKEEAYKSRIQELERNVQTLHDIKVNPDQLKEKDKNFLITLSLKDKDIEDKNKEIAKLQRMQVEFEKTWHSTKERMDKYMLEVEEWKRSTIEVFQQQIATKDRELSELRETLELLTKKSDTKEQDTLVNQLLDFINNNPSNEPTVKVIESVPSTPDRVNNLKKSEDMGSKIGSVSPQPLLKTSGPKLKSLKVLLPSNEGSLSIGTKEEMTLNNVLEIICSKKKWPLTGGPSYSFHHLDSLASLPLSTPVSTLAVPAIALQKRDPKLLGKESDNNIGLPYNVQKNRTVEELIKIMETEIDQISEGEGGKTLVKPCPGFDVELGKKQKPNTTVNIRKLIDDDKNTAWYRDYFFNQAHVSYYGDAGPRVGPVLVFLKLVENQIVLQQVNKMMALVRSKFDDEWVFIPASTKSLKKPLTKAIEQQCRNGEKMQNLKLVKIKHKDGPKELLTLEQKLLTSGYKFGVLYCKAGQTHEDDMFSNNDTSPEYEEFLNFLGDRITLQGWAGYRGGLDVKSNATGKTSVFTKHLNYEIMFHVSTLLPYFPQDPQQLERKRHLGNDVCVIVFKDTDEPFSPDCVKSEFIHVYAVITPDKSNTDTVNYKVAFAYKGGVGLSQPPLPSPSVFAKSPQFREFLLTKLINSERGAMYAPSFVTKMSKTKELQIQALVDKFKTETQ